MTDDDNPDDMPLSEWLFFRKREQKRARAQHTTRSTTREKDDR